ncbi:ZIP zinc transporter-domain-containing protein [Pavlovales sp. CCMP2436]|nr:ZIP zinc transporter-domain-containing protein [Pavlovales sp. CCMP2436]
MADTCDFHPSVCAAEAAARATEHSWAAFFDNNPWTGAFSATMLISLLPLLLVALAPLEATFAKYKNTLVTFAAGALLGDVCLHILPHALARDSSSHGSDAHHEHEHGHGHEHEHEHGHAHAHGIEDLAGGLAIIAGIMAFLALEKLVRGLRGGHGNQHQHDGGQKATSSKVQVAGSPPSGAPTMLVGGYLNLVADFAHNFTDGLAIGAAFGSGKGNLATTLAVLCHEVPHEVGDVAILMRSGMPRGQALRVQMLTAVGAMIGTYVGLVAGDMPVVSRYVSCFIAGGFIYVATVNVIPSLFEESSTLLETLLELAAMAAGVAIMVGVALLE